MMHLDGYFQLFVSGFFPQNRDLRINHISAGDHPARPHQGLDQQIPVRSTAPSGSGLVHWRIVLGGILHDYYREAA
jgi:hypothetical protein